MLTKLKENLGNDALLVLGMDTYLHMLTQFVTCLPAILKSRSLAPLDKAMSGRLYQLSHRLGTFWVDAGQVDRLIQEDSYAYGAIRELYIRDCYFRGHPGIDARKIRNVIDLGGNRGLFSTLCTSFCEKLTIVEVQPQYNDVIHYNITTTNHFTNYLLVNAFIGYAGKMDSEKQSHIRFDELITRSQMDTIDFLKIDIEGSEFDLFQEELSLDRVRYISMEIHPAFGDVTMIIEKLKRYQFDVKTTTDTFSPTTDPTLTDFLYARNKRLTAP